jgi:hypothetical protein
VNAKDTHSVLRSITYAAIVLIISLIGITTHIYSTFVPEFISYIGGDILWAFAVFFLLSILFPGKSALSRTLITIGISVVIELQQLYQAPWIEAIRETLLGNLILGFHFSWLHLFCYLVGAILGALSEQILFEKSRYTR